MNDKHEHEEGKVVRGHQSGTALQKELVSHLPLSVASAAIGLALAGIICYFVSLIANIQSERVHVQACGHEKVTHGEEHANELANHDPKHGGELGHNHTVSSPEAGIQHSMHENEQGCTEHGHDHDSGLRPLFHVFHPLHMLFSAAATTAMFWRYDRRMIRAIVVGIVGSIGICGLSDIIIPHISLLLLGKHIPWHICIVEHPAMVLPFAAMGVLLGLVAAMGVTQSTFYSHSLHVFVSTMASIFYIVNGHEGLEWVSKLGVIFFFVVFAVVVPCCFSDIIFPVAMSSKAREKHACTSCCH